MYDFDELTGREGTCCVKYDVLKEVTGRTDLIPLWVADMDFRTPDFIIDALKKRLEHPVLGYTEVPRSYYDAVSSWVAKIHGWNIEKEWISFIPGIVKGIGMALSAFLGPGDKVVIQTPVYHPFRSVPQDNGYEVLCNPLVPVYEDGEGRAGDMAGKDRDRVLKGYRMDFEQLESVLDAKTRILILANPHNPAGICWDRQTLEKLAEITSRHGMIVISDEIHSEMVYEGRPHCPYACVSEAACSNSITFMAPSKTFNIAGVVSSYAVVPDSHLRERFFSYLKANEFDSPSIFQTIAAEAAYTHGEQWRHEMLDYVRGNIIYTDKYLRSEIPQIRALVPDASFLIWLDCRSLALPQDGLVSLFTDKAHLALNDGTMFGPEGAGFMRLNAGCPRSVLERAMHQLRAAVNGL